MQRGEELAGISITMLGGTVHVRRGLAAVALERGRVRRDARARILDVSDRRGVMTGGDAAAEQQHDETERDHAKRVARTGRAHST